MMRHAWTRFARNRGALAAFLLLIAMTLACLVGPRLTGHEPGRIYPDLVRTAPGLAAHPEPDEIAPALTRLAFRMRLSVSDIAVTGDTVRMVFSGISKPDDAKSFETKPIDERVLVYLPRSDLFGPASIVERRDGGRRLVVEAPLRRLRFLMGTDMLGRDVLTRSLVAGRVSLLIGAVATAVALLVGIAYGALAGYLGGAVDAVMMRVVDMLYALPFVFFVIMLLVFFRSGLGLILVAIGAVEWLDMARLVRAQTLSLRHRDFVRAAEALGLSTAAILRRHIVPNTLGPVTVAATLLVPKVILLESFLSFLGLGVQEPATSWGALIAEGARALESAPWMLAGPAAFLVSTLVALNVLGDGLGDALDPRIAGR
ncbi:Oligopeptide transport system permease protein OppC [Methylobacterium bullatum]|uniref:Oligopeptide transport system permease protein OppC n=1 Tax=Methylobacterium bullatum TaxID=570505 RepID=A0A679JI05_9HYPH|nr:Oligopeptide transport system permease protein OppC [Methylobacterium bullatum]